MPTLLFLHGWGGNADSFAPITAYFRRQSGYRVLTPAFPCPPAQIYTLDDYVNDLVQFLRWHDVQHCVVIAHSFGARLAVLLNVRCPGLITQMIVTGGAGLPPRWSIKRWWRLRRNRARGGSPDYRNLSPAGKRTFQNIIHRDLTPEIKQIKVPLCLIYGSRDDQTPPSMMYRWARLVPHAQTIIYPGAGHFAYLDCVARFINDVKHHLITESQ